MPKWLNNPFIAALIASGMSIGFLLAYLSPQTTSANNVNYASRQELGELKHEFGRKLDSIGDKLDRITLAVGRLQGAQDK